jgi:predicted DNA-binding protein (MmcQ/YjbR family)
MAQTLKDFRLNIDYISIKCDNTSAISLSKNHIHYSRTKHIEVRHHFLRDYTMKDDIVLEFVSIKYQLVDFFTKLLSKDRFCKIRRNLDFIHANDI